MKPLFSRFACLLKRWSELPNANSEVSSSAVEIARLRAQLIDAQVRHAQMGSHLEQRVEWRTQELSIANERLETANQQLEAFNYMVSHDLRASLRSIDGYLDVLLEDLGPNQTDTVINDIQQLHTSVDRLRATLSELLKLAHVGHGELNRHHVDLSAMCHEIVAELRLCEPHRLVDVDIAENIGVYANHVLMREVLQNLLTNAWKFTARRERARIQFGMQQELDNIVYFVRDNGAGFDMRRRDELFLPFHRLHAEQEFKGTGVGLATARRIVERHGGKIWAHATPDQGAKFSFTLHQEDERSVA